MLIIKQRVWLWLASNAPISTVHWLGRWPLLRLLVLHVATSGGSSNFTTGGGRILGIWGLFWCPFTQTLCFCGEGRDKIHTVNIVCWQQLMYVSVIQLKFAKTNPEQISNGGVRSVHQSWIRPWLHQLMAIGLPSYSFLLMISTILPVFTHSVTPLTVLQLTLIT